jgi:acetoacetyl-CoA synthetase
MSGARQIGEVLWRPSANRIAASQLSRFMNWLRDNKNVGVSDYPSLWRWSTQDINGFWMAIWEYFGIISDGHFDTAVSNHTMFGSRWFEGARVNYTEHLLRHEMSAAPEDVALYHCSETRPIAAVTWAQLGEQVRIVATAMRALGIRPGDRVVAYLPNIIEAAVAMLATTAIGAVWSSAAPEFGVKTVVERFGQIAPKLAFVADGYTFGGRTFDRRKEACLIIQQLPTLKHVVTLQYLGLGMVAPAGDFHVLSWHDLASSVGSSNADFQFERVPDSHPLWLLYSSGTTGLPKPIVHNHVGILLEQLKNKALQLDLGSGKCMFLHTTTGWMMWNSLLGALAVGCAVVLYDGSPTYPASDSLWEIIEKTGTTTFGASPTLIGSMISDSARSRTRNFSQLEAVIMGGAPMTAELQRRVYDYVKSDLWVTSQSGGTELCSSLVGGIPIEPIRAGVIQGRALGMDVHAWDENGRDVIDEPGELVVTKPFPSMPLGFWGDSDGRRYFDAYFSFFSGVWRHGDLIVFASNGSCQILGRSDSTLNRFGVRIGSAEIYRIVEQMPEIDDSLIVCCELPEGKFYMPLFVKVREGQVLDAALIVKIRSTLKGEASPRHVPDDVFQVPAVPYTLTGKKLELPVKRILLGRPLEQAASRDSMSDPSALDWFVKFASTEMPARLVGGKESAQC